MFDINAKVTKKADFTYLDILHYIYDNGGEIDNRVIEGLSKTFGVSTIAIKRYIKKMKDESVIENNKISEKYIKELKKIYGSPKLASKPSPSKDIEHLIDPRILKKFPSIKVGKNNSRVKYIFEKILDNMKAQAKGRSVVSIMLTGKPGTGKTSLIRSFSKFTGLPLITIEAPHINEEHIVNIPYFVFVGNKKKEGNFVLEEKGNDIELVHAESNLVSEIKKIKKKKLSDEEWEKMVLADKNLENIFYDLWDVVSEIRENYDAILFLDEFYRVENERTKNALRNILNGFIGYDRIPKGVYIIYATNLGDSGVSEIPLNHEFKHEELDTPSKDDWFGYILGKYVHNATEETLKKVKLNPDVFNAFYEVLSEEDLSYEDDEAEVRVSPRRWEQILLYVNANLPVKNKKEAELLLYNIKMNFTNYETGETAELYENKIKPLLIKLIKKTSGIDIVREAKAIEWMDALKQQIETKMKLGEFRQYVPALSGKHGIGKTAFIRSIADEYNMILVNIDVSNMDRDQITGIPMMQKTGEIGPDGKPIVKTEFRKPSLLQIIEKQIAEKIEERKKAGLPLPEGEYKYLIFFDELSRTSDDVFNAIRRILLEGKFNHEHALPKGSMVVSAFNPTDVGANQLTEHTRDVLDIIISEPDWDKVIEYIRESGSGLIHEIDVDVFERVIELKSADVDIDGNEIEDMNMKKFYIGVQGVGGVYVSPRLLSDIVSEIDSSIESALDSGIFRRFDGDVPGVKLNLKKINNYILGIDDETFDEANKEYFKTKVKDEEIEKILGMYDPALDYQPEEKALYILAMIMIFIDKFTSGIRFEIMKNIGATSKKNPDLMEMEEDTYNLIMAENSGGAGHLIKVINRFIDVISSKKVNEDEVNELRAEIEEVISNNEILALYNKLFEKSSGITELVDLKNLFEVCTKPDVNVAELFSPTLFSFFDAHVDFIKITNDVSEILKDYIKNGSTIDIIDKNIGDVADKILENGKKIYKIIRYLEDNDLKIEFGKNLFLNEKEIDELNSVSKKEFFDRMEKIGIKDEDILENAWEFRKLAGKLANTLYVESIKNIEGPFLFLLVLVKYILNKMVDDEGNLIEIKNSFGTLISSYFEIIRKELRISNFIKKHANKVAEIETEDDIKKINLYSIFNYFGLNNSIRRKNVKEGLISVYMKLMECVLNSVVEAPNNEFVFLFRNINAENYTEIVGKITEEVKNIISKYDLCKSDMDYKIRIEEFKEDTGFNDDCVFTMKKIYCEHLVKI